MKNFVFITYNNEGINTVVLIRANNEIEALISIISQGKYGCLDDVPNGQSIESFAKECLGFIRSEDNYMDGDSKDGIYFKEIEFLSLEAR